MNKEQHEALKLANKIYLNSYECMWNDAMIDSLKNNFFYFYNPNIIRKTRKFGQKITRKLMSEIFDYIKCDGGRGDIATHFELDD